MQFSIFIDIITGNKCNFYLTPLDLTFDLHWILGRAQGPWASEDGSFSACVAFLDAVLQQMEQ